VEQLALFSFDEPPAPVEILKESPALATPDLASYDYYLIAFSGGKDSEACVLNLLERGVDRSKIEIMHHDVDGGQSFFDWPVTTAYCRAFAKAFQLPIYMSWREGGILREMLRDGAPTAPVAFEQADGTIGRAGGDGPLGTRKKFPQCSASLQTRWCSSAAKVDVGAAAVRGQDRFLGKRTLFITGERAQESAARSKYLPFEPHRTDTRDGTRRARHVDHWRPILHWTEQEVWAILQRHGVNPHPCYWLGVSRASCAFCIFSNADQWATLKHIWPERFEVVANYEQEFGVTIKRNITVRDLAAKGRPYPPALEHPEIARLALSEHYDIPILVDPASWTLPPGAFGEGAGPT
jgi:3'-phosphoadenosine 5'-phosphosulfate sulfotransferase (PAPS reductase)/FAD synthetase